MKGGWVDMNNQADEIIWQLPVKHSSISNHDWIHPKAKYHAFKNDKSMCEKYNQDVYFFENTISETELMRDKREYACNKCINAIRKLKQGEAHE